MASPSDDEDAYLEDIWTVYFHEPSDSDWTFKSYSNIATFSTVQEFRSISLALESRVHLGMFFLMREHIYPCYDDVENLQGGCFTLKVPMADTPRYWHQLCMRVLGETLVSDMSRINGISVSPKRGFCIVKVWVGGGEELGRSALDLPPGHIGDVLFKLW